MESNGNSTYELMKRRCSVRSFSDIPVEEEKIEKILKAGRLAPTACNIQPQRVLVIQTPEGLEKWSRCTRCHYNEQVVFLICYDADESWKREFDGTDSGFVDASIVTTHMMLEAAELGVGSTWIMYFIPEAVRAEFDLPASYVPVSALVMGYPDEDFKPSPKHYSRKDLSETVFFETFEV